MSYITTYCSIKNGDFIVNGKEPNKLEGINFLEQVNALYKKKELKYPKFHKMDLLAKTAFLGSELIKEVRSESLASYADDEIALFFGNSESSAYSDEKFYDSYSSNNPSPSQFIYTLPNILIGEIAIKNKWFGENLFLVLPDFDTKEYVEQIQLLLNNSKAVLCGWVNINENNADTFFFLIEKEGESTNELNTNNLLKIYNL